jgi:type IV pilus biogenesis protein CpaD/CtpE
VTDQESEGGAHTLEITGEMDRHAAEALRLEILRLARGIGIEVDEIRIQKAAPEE